MVLISYVISLAIALVIGRQTELEAADWEHALLDLMNERGHPDLRQLYIYTARTYVHTQYREIIIICWSFNLITCTTWTG